MSRVAPFVLPACFWIVVVSALAALAGASLFCYLSFRRRRPDRSATSAENAQELNVFPVETVNFKFIAAEHAKLKKEHERVRHHIETRLKDLRAKDWETTAVEDVLPFATPPERETLCTILRLSADSQARAIATALRRAGSNDVAAGWRKLRRRDPYVTYRAVLQDSANWLGVKTEATNVDDSVLERSIVLAAFEKLMNKATPEQKAELMRELKAQQNRMLGGVGATAGAITLAHLSGFGLYIAASTALGSMTTALGVTLPFAVYTGMSSTIALLIGPIGWAAIAVGGAAVLGRVNYKRTVFSVLSIAAVRARLIAERDRDIASLEVDRHGKLAALAVKVAALWAILERMKKEGLKTIPKRSVPL